MQRFQSTNQNTTMRRHNFCREMERRAPLRGPLWTLGGCALYMGLPEVSAALTFLKRSPSQGLSRHYGHMPSSSAQHWGHTFLVPMPTITFSFLNQELCLASRARLSELRGSKEKPVLQAHPLGYVQDGGATALQFPRLASCFSALTP